MIEPSPLTQEERETIAGLRRLAERWPKTLWVYCGSGFHVMKTGPGGERMMTRGGGTDPRFVVANLDIPQDGGDW